MNRQLISKVLAALLGAFFVFNGAMVHAQVIGPYPPFPYALTAGNCIKALNSFQGQDAGAPCGAGTVSSGTQNQMAWYAATGSAVSGLATANSGVLVTSSGGVPSISATLPSGLTIPSPTFTGISTFPSATTVDASGRFAVGAAPVTAAGFDSVLQVNSATPARLGLHDVTANTVYGVANNNDVLEIGRWNGASWPVALSISNASVVTFGGGMTNTHLSTGTNADTVCISAAGVFLIQAAACTISFRDSKKDIETLSPEDGLSSVMKMNPVSFQFKEKNRDENGNRVQLGLIADEVADIDGRMAVYFEDGVTPKSYRQEAVLAAVIGAIKAQQKQIEDMKRGVK